jgi:hypothetical protein
MPSISALSALFHLLLISLVCCAPQSSTAGACNFNSFPPAAAAGNEPCPIFHQLVTKSIKSFDDIKKETTTTLVRRCRPPSCNICTTMLGSNWPAATKTTNCGGDHSLIKYKNSPSDTDYLYKCKPRACSCFFSFLLSCESA